MRASVKSVIRLTTAGLSAAGAIALLAPGTATAMTATSYVKETSVQVLAAPCVVRGYSNHALEEMAADGIGTELVENVVYNTCSRAVKQSNGNYKYTSGKIVVIVSPRGIVVTAWRKS
ncbi:DUF4258 domain-containing protein [Nonomuraea sp. NPDC059007]|uniref:DUF4258 domain-containing protein n=1 Tax=Nonomuraea sp. NPDC059007 TaxID=3346692 RepID=UPI0036AE2023